MDKKSATNKPEKKDVSVVGQGIDQLLTDRKIFKEKVEPILEKDTDWHSIKDRKSLAKGGAEKLATIFGLRAEFLIDKETAEMILGGSAVGSGTVFYICRLYKNGQVMGEGRGADYMKRNQGDPNKTVKMAQKRAFIDAVIRTTGLSDIFTQDLGPEDGNGHDIPASSAKTEAPKNYQPKQAVESVTQKQMSMIFALAKERYGLTSKEQVLPWINLTMNANYQHLSKLTKNEATRIISRMLENPEKVNEENLDKRLGTKPPPGNDGEINLDEIDFDGPDEGV